MMKNILIFIGLLCIWLVNIWPTYYLIPQACKNINKVMDRAYNMRFKHLKGGYCTYSDTISDSRVANYIKKPMELKSIYLGTLDEAYTSLIYRQEGTILHKDNTYKNAITEIDLELGIPEDKYGGDGCSFTSFYTKYNFPLGEANSYNTDINSEKTKKFIKEHSSPDSSKASQ